MITRRKLLKVTAAGSLAYGFGGLATPAIAQGAKIRIGYVSPQTGPLASFGESDAYNIASFLATEAGKNFEVIVKDSQSNPNRAADVAKELILSDEINLMLVASTPETTNPVATTCEAEGVPCISTKAPWQPWRLPGFRVRDTGIGAVMLMDAQIDHSTGLLMLRENRQPLQIWCHPLVREDLSTGNPLFKVLDHYCKVDWQALSLEPQGFVIERVPGLRFAALPLISNAPPYSPHRDKPQDGDNIGLSVSDAASGKTLFYAPGLGRMEPHVWQAMQASDCVLVDGTLWTDDEMIALGASKKTS
eukprot:gene47238-63295_t